MGLAMRRHVLGMSPGPYLLALARPAALALVAAAAVGRAPIDARGAAGTLAALAAVFVVYAVLVAAARGGFVKRVASELWPGAAGDSR
jgi:hypothetical protein